MAEFLTGAFWVAVGQIILIDILLGGDNAVVIALACRGLPAKQRKMGIIYGTAGAIVLRVILIAFALALLAIPYLKLVGGLLLIWIGVKLLMPQDDDDHGNIQSSDKLWGAVKTVIIADLVMSVDNVLAIAGAAESAGQHQLFLVIFGLLVSIPIIVAGSQMYTDPGVKPYLPESKTWEYAAAAAGALLVLAIGKAAQLRKAPAEAS
jgi:YjbE family integral membrane protein